VTGTPSTTSRTEAGHSIDTSRHQPSFTTETTQSLQKTPADSISAAATRSPHDPAPMPGPPTATHPSV
jgi:hypothetical protein